MKSCSIQPQIMMKVINSCNIYKYFFIIIIFFCSGCKEENQLFTKKNDTLKNRDDTKVTQHLNSETAKYAVSKYFTPVLNSSDFNSVYGGKNGMTLKRSRNGLIKELEYVAYPGSVFEILSEIKKEDHKIYKVKTDEYEIPELEIELFIDSRFVSLTDFKPEKRKISLPSKNEIFDYLDKCVGAMYVWGANNLDGVPQMFEFYQPKGNLSESEKKEWMMKGLDCSGLLYEATNGYTARNTHQLVYFGEPVKISGLTARQIASEVKPLDLIVWKGHIILVYDENTTIESSFTAGKVVKKNLIDVVNNLISKRKPVDEWTGGKKNEFVIRRWFNEDMK